MVYRNKIISWLAESECEKVCRKTIRVLQKMTEEMQSGDDTPLKNLWDEVCVQVQHQQSMFWNAYLEIIQNIVLDEVLKLETVVNEAIWLQSDEGKEWEFERKYEIEGEQESKNEELDSAKFTVQLITDRIIFEATDYTGERIVLIEVDKLRSAVKEAIWLKTRWAMNRYSEAKIETDYERENFERVQRFIGDIDEIIGDFAYHILSETTEVSNSGLVSIQLDKLNASVEKVNEGIDWYGERKIYKITEKYDFERPPYDENDIVEYILSIVLSKAADWTNASIEEYLDQY